MGHRALVAYERTDGQYTLHYSHWGAANLKLKHRISAESPFGGDDDLLSEDRDSFDFDAPQSNTPTHEIQARDAWLRDPNSGYAPVTGNKPAAQRLEQPRVRQLRPRQQHVGGRPGYAGRGHRPRYTRARRGKHRRRHRDRARRRRHPHRMDQHVEPLLTRAKRARPTTRRGPVERFIDTWDQGLYTYR